MNSYDLSDKSNIFYSDDEKDKTKYYFKIFKNNDKVTEAESIIKKWLNTKDLESNIDLILSVTGGAEFCSQNHISGSFKYAIEQISTFENTLIITGSKKN
jgi:hypothetical protein